MKSDRAWPLAAKIVLAIGAHADDLDFMAGATLAKLAANGSAVYYLILTDGCKGTTDPSLDCAELAATRQQEQRAAAKIIGARDVFFATYEDGALKVDRPLLRDVVGYIRRLKPDVVIAMDPTMMYCPERNFINHPDHRAGGQAALDAVYPLARDHLEFPEQLVDGLQPHKVSTVLLTNFNTANFFVDIMTSIDCKISALAAHPSQMADMAQVEQVVRTHAGLDGQRIDCQYAEGFVRIETEP